MKKMLLTIFSCFLMSPMLAQDTMIDSLLNLLQTSKEDTTKVNNLNSLAWVLSSQNPDTAFILSNNALMLAQRINLPGSPSGWQPGIGQAYHQLGYFHFLIGNFMLSLDYYAKAMAVWELMEKNISGNQHMLSANKKAATIGNIGVVYFNIGDYPKALENYLMVMKLCQASGNKNLFASMLSNLGILYNEQHDLTKALDYYFKALKINLDTGNKKYQSGNYSNIGILFNDQGDYQKAIDYFNMALKINHELGNVIEIAKNLCNLGVAYDNLKNYSKALEYYFEALKLNKEHENSFGEASCLNNIGSLYTSIGKYEEAEKYLCQSLLLAQYMGSLEGIRLNNEKLSELFEKTGDYKKSLAHFRRAMEVNDSLFSEEKEKEITAKAMNYEFEKREAFIKAGHEKKEALAHAEIKRQTLIRNSTFGGVGIVSLFSFLLVRSSNRRKKTTFDKQVSEVEMKALRSQMNPHFIFNALQSVNDFVLKKDTSNASNFLIKFAKLMRAVLENSVHKEVSLEKDLASLELYMQLESSRLDYPFEYEIVIDPKIDPEETLIPPLILQPFVENSIWHGLKHKKERGKIKIEIKEVNNSIVCSIEDNGVGREQASMLKEPTPEKRESLGMKLTKERLKILEQIKNFKSRIDVTDLKDAMNNPLGLRVELSLPLATLN